LTAQTAFTLINPQTGELAFKLFEFEDDAYFREMKHYNYYAMLLVTAGKGKIRVDGAEYEFTESSLICFSIYQPFKLTAEKEFCGILINFHPDFFCIHKHHNEVACNGVLFNNIYESPVVPVDLAQLQYLLHLSNQLKAAVQHIALAQFELLVSYLKIFLISASRCKVNRQSTPKYQSEKEPFMLKTLKDAIEDHYKTKHFASDYAGVLNISAKALNRVSKTHFNKTLSNLIAERIIIEAKRELYLTAKPVKRIAYELGFNDEFYFSRFFKSNANVSPQIYRETVGFDRATG
jgi:AraC family transcriptional activator of pobA